MRPNNAFTRIASLTMALVMLICGGLGVMPASAAVDTDSAVISQAINSETGKLKYIGRYATGSYDEDGGTAEIVKYNPVNKKLYVVNGKAGTLDIVSARSLQHEGFADLAKVKKIDVSKMVGDKGMLYGDVTSVDVNTSRGIIAIAVQAKAHDAQGYIVILNYLGEYMKHYQAGVQPDMVTFSHDGKYVLSADEGEPRNGYENGAIDPKGSVTIVNLDTEDVKTATFDDFDAQRQALVDEKVLLKTEAAPSVDLEPEYIVVSADSKTAYVSLQEANAIATLDIENASFSAVKSLGFKDHNLNNNKIDAKKDGEARLETVEGLYGVYMPDGLAGANIGGVDFILSANEGDAREWAEYANIEDWQIATSTNNKAINLEVLKNNEHDALTNDNAHYALGGRSFAIWNAATMEQVFESGSEFEAKLAEKYPTAFNTTHKEVKLDGRSGKKGPEPETVATMQVAGKTYAFIALERIGGIMMYDITDPANATFADYINARNFEEKDLAKAMGLGPEGLHAVEAQNSPTGYPLLFVANEVSGDVQVFEVQEGKAEPKSEITIFHTNDSHGRIYQVDKNNTRMIGIDKIAALKKKTENAILVDAGDTIHGLPIAGIHKGQNTVDLMAAAGYSVSVPGNHDFNYGSNRLKELSKRHNPQFDIISSNVEYKTGGTLLDTTKIVEQNGVKVGFFGLSTQTTPVVTNPTNVSELTFGDYKAAAETAIAKLRKEGATVIVALAHVTHPDIENLVKTLDDEPDIIIEGHDHLKGSKVVEGVLIAGAYQHQESVGQVDVSLNADGILLSSKAKVLEAATFKDAASDEDIKAMAEKMKKEVTDVYNEVVAESEVLLSSHRGSGTTQGVRNSEQALGNLVADAMRITAGADFAVTNGGGLRENIEKGKITRGVINSILPFGNYLVVKEITAQQLKAVMEEGLKDGTNTNGRFPQISGMNVVWNPAQPVGQKIVSISANGRVLDLNDTKTIYKFATNDFMAAGGDGYTAIKDLPVISNLDSLDVVLENYIKTQLNGVVKAENAKIEGRLQIQASKPAPAPTPAPSNNGGGNSGSGSSNGGGFSGGSSTGASKPAEPKAAPVSAKQATDAMKAALAAKSTTAKLKNVGVISKDILKAMAKQAGSTPAKIQADSMSADGKSVDVRVALTIGNTMKDINLSAATYGPQTVKSKQFFQKWFNSRVAVIGFAQKGAFNANVDVAAKVDLTGMDKKALVLYSYNAAKNTYTKLPAQTYSVDKNGYLRFTTPVGGDIIISQGALVRK